MGEKGQERRARRGKDGGMDGETEGICAQGPRWSRNVGKEGGGNETVEDERREREENKHRDRGCGWILTPCFTNT